jgi:hypothetical protein
MKAAGPDTAKLLRWYPRGWRERYGEEFLAMIEDSLAGRRPGWRLRLSVARAGLRERGHQARLAGQKEFHQARLAGQKELRGYVTLSWYSCFVGGFFLAGLPNAVNVRPAARAWLATAASDTLMAIAAITGVALLAGGLAAAPAFVRYLRTGGWPEVRRRIAWTAAATTATGGALAGLVLASRGQTLYQAFGSWTYDAGLLMIDLAQMVVLWLWISTVTAISKRLVLPPGVRAAEKVLGAVAVSAVPVMSPVGFIAYLGNNHALEWLLAMQLSGVAVMGLAGYRTIRRAARSARHLAAASSPGQ